MRVSVVTSTQTKQKVTHGKSEHPARGACCMTMILSDMFRGVGCIELTSNQ
jgi:hypothetical protein